jgi:hypothetical protein
LVGHVLATLDKAGKGVVAQPSGTA